MESQVQGEFECWLAGRRRAIVLLLPCGAVLAAILGAGVLFLYHWVLVSVWGSLLAMVGVASWAGGGIQLWQIHVASGLCLVSLFGFASWLRIRSDESARLFDLVSWSWLVEGCRGPRLSFFSGSSPWELLVDVLLLGPRLVMTAWQLLGLASRWLRLRKAVCDQLLQFLHAVEGPRSLAEMQQVFWSASMAETLRDLELVDGVIVGAEMVALSPELRHQLQAIKQSDP